MNTNLASVGANFMETLHNTWGGLQVALSSAYLEFLMQHGLQDGNDSRLLFLRLLEETTPLPTKEVTPHRVVSTSMDFEDLAHRTQRSQEQEIVREQPWMKAVFEAQRDLQSPTSEMITNCIDLMEFRAIGISGGS